MASWTTAALEELLKSHRGRSVLSFLLPRLLALKEGSVDVLPVQQVCTICVCMSVMLVVGGKIMMWFLTLVVFYACCKIFLCAKPSSTHPNIFFCLFLRLVTICAYFSFVSLSHVCSWQFSVVLVTDRLEQWLWLPRVPLMPLWRASHKYSRCC